MGTSVARTGFRHLIRRAGLASAPLLLAAAACTGDRTVGDSESPETQAPESVAPTEAPPEAQTFEQLLEDPCAAVDEDEAELLGYLSGPPDPHADTETPGCGWDTGTISLSFSMYPRTDAATQAATWERGRTTQTQVGGREAIQSEFMAICIVNVAVDADRSIQVLAIGDYTIQEQLCPASTGLAEAVLEDLERAS